MLDLEFEPGSPPSALDALARELIDAKVNRQTVEETLDGVPRWRFMLRAELEREARQHRKRERRLLVLFKDV